MFNMSDSIFDGADGADSTDTLQMPQNLLRNIFLIWERNSQIKKILGNFFSKEDFSSWEKFFRPFHEKVVLT